jgi:hypothetical protein
MVTLALATTTGDSCAYARPATNRAVTVIVASSLGRGIEKVMMGTSAEWMKQAPTLTEATCVPLPDALEPADSVLIP